MEIVKDSKERQIFSREEVEKSTLEYFGGDQLATTVWIDKYSLKNKISNEAGLDEVEYYELNPDMMHRRIAKEFARIELKYPEPMNEEEIYELLKGFKYIIPQGSPMAGIGNPFVNTSISNCFLIGNHPDSYGGIMSADEEQVQLMKRRGGVGQDLSHLRPSGAQAGGVPLGDNCGMTLYMDRYSNSTREVQQDGRRGALMLSVSINHPDSEKFIDKKMTPGSVTGANVSIKISEKFMDAEKAGTPFFQTFPIEMDICEILNVAPNYLHLVEKGYEFNKLYTGPEINGRKTYFKKVDPKSIWKKLCHNAWKSAEPGILFWDQIIKESPCAFYGPAWEEKGTNPCFTGDTLVAVADDRQYVPFSILAEEGKDVEVFSESPNGVIVIKTMRNPRMVSKNARILKITFANGKFVEATADHKFYLVNNEAVEAKNLKQGQCLRIISRFKDERGNVILNKDSKHHGDLPKLKITSIVEAGEKPVYNGIVDDYHNYFVGNFKGKADKKNNSIKTANCGEIPLPPDDSCRLLLLNLYGYITNKFQSNAYFEDMMFQDHVEKAMRLMDDIVDLEIEKIDLILEEVSQKPYDEKFQRTEIELWTKIRQKAVDGRRTGLGITGEGDMMAALGIKYGTAEGTEFSEKLHQLLATHAYKASIDLAEERGTFSIWDPNDIESSNFLTRMFFDNELMLDEIKEKAYKFGRRNIAILTIAPAGSVSLMSQTSSGVEPIFAPWYFRKKKVTNEDYFDVIDEVGDKWIEYPVFHKPFIDFYAGATGISFEVAEGILMRTKEKELREIFEKSPYFGATAQDVDYVEKVRMQGAIQKWIDHSISVTVNMPEHVTEEIVEAVYRQAFESGCKGVTVYRDNSRGNVLSTTSDKEKSSEEKFEYINSIKRPKELPCDVFFKTSRGSDFLIFVGKLEDKPYEVFAVPFSIVTTVSKKMKSGILIKQGKGIYSLADSEGKLLIYNLGEYMVENEQNSTRMLSSLLRHRVDPGFVAETIFKFATINSFHQVIAKVLQSYSDKGGVKCPECNSKMQMAEGCMKCTNCGHAHCG
jgi:ribonucleotide reductase alpha subunit